MIWPASISTTVDAERRIDRARRTPERYTLIDRLAILAYHVLSLFV